jgi:hypothetical protein
VETSGYQPVAPEPEDKPGGFAPAPSPAPTTDSGWTSYSFVAESPVGSSSPFGSPTPPAPAADLDPLTAPLAAVEGGALPPAATSTYDFGLEAAAPATFVPPPTPVLAEAAYVPQQAAPTYEAPTTVTGAPVAPLRQSLRLGARPTQP